MPRKNGSKYAYFTYTIKRPLGVCVYGWGIYPRGSVLAGQPMKVFVDSFDTVEEAEKAYPGIHGSSRFTEPQVSLNHLPGEDDPEPGGMYPDDIGASWSR